MPEPFRTTRRVEFVDTDMAGIAHFSNFFRWMESVEVEFLHTLGLSVKMRTEDGQPIGFPRVSASCDYLRPVRFEDVFEVTIRLHKLGSKSVTWQFDFSKDGEVIAKGQVTAVCCRVLPPNKLESIDIPESIRAKLQ
jgi:acyl-CoA thioester hydrolase